MQGATEFARLFETGQVGRFYFVSYSHARGECFHIYILPDGEKAISNGNCNAPLNKDAVEVFGIIAGQPGWTETYGWLHEGKWREDFMVLVNEKKAEISQKESQTNFAKEKIKKKEAQKIKELLGKY